MEEIVDAHIHIWRQADLPWLSGPVVPRIFGRYEPLRRDYPIEEYVGAARAAGIGAAVYVQPNWPLERSVEEVEWVDAVARASGWPQAIVGSADMFAPGARETFARQRDASPLVRGTRLQLHWHEDPRFRYASAPDRMNDATFRENLGALAELGWLFELQVFPGQAADAAALAADFPQLTFVLVHALMLEGTGAEQLARWRAGLALLAAQPNVVAKLSGQGTFVHRVDARLIALVATTAIELFGSSRCMFGSNFPIESLWTDLPALVEAWRRALAAVDDGARRDVLSETARRVYGLASRGRSA
ncbi:MAG TPA: amidohydrolase family protein [Solirubrobacteraceae bacterium]